MFKVIESFTEPLNPEYNSVQRCQETHQIIRIYFEVLEGIVVEGSAIKHDVDDW